MSKYKPKYATQINIDAETQELSFGDIANKFFERVIKEFEKPFVDKIIELGYTLEQLKNGELNDLFKMECIEGEYRTEYNLQYKGEKVVIVNYPKEILTIT